METISRLREQAGSASRGFVGHMGSWISSKLGNSTVSPKYVLVVGFSLSVCFFVLPIRNPSLFIVDEDDFDCSPLPSQAAPQQDPGKALAESIRRARRRVNSAVSDFESPLQAVSPEALNTWNKLHPCLSRRPADGLVSFYNRSRGQRAESVPANPIWDEVFEEYSNLHRECMEKVGDIGEYFLQKNTSSGCKFLIADVANKTEFGDKILVHASSLLYAILTHRVILIPGSTLVPSYMCEPFVGSSWLLHSSSSFALLSNSLRQLWEPDREIFGAVDSHRRTCSSFQNEKAQAPYAAAGIGIDQWQPQQRFYCTREQNLYSETTFVYLSGYVYTIPKLFATPLFRAALEALFPDRIVLTRLLRSAFLPGNPIWKRVMGLNQGYLQPAHRRVGIELRYTSRGGLPRFKGMHKVINRRIIDCMIDGDILPNVVNTWEARRLRKPRSSDPIRISRVLISSLDVDLKDHLTWLYDRNPTLTGEAVGVVQVSQFSGNPQFGAESDAEVFKEAILLSFSDQLLVMPMSTLGSVAQAYGALIPWFIDVRKDRWFNRYGNCQQGRTIEVCSHFASKKYSCPASDSSKRGHLISEVVPYIENCPTIDHDGGIQLITRSRR